MKDLKCQICGKNSRYVLQIWDDEGTEMEVGIILCSEHALMFEQLITALIHTEVEGSNSPE